jgi:hypothetical protein
MATVTPGDTVDVVWLESQQYETGTVELVEFGAVRIAIAGTPQVVAWLPVTKLRAAGVGRWSVEL